MVFCYPSFQIRVHNSHQDFGGHSKKGGYHSEAKHLFSSQTDGQMEHTTQTLKDMIIDCIIDLKGNWDRHFPLVEFSYNNS